MQGEEQHQTSVAVFMMMQHLLHKTQQFFQLQGTQTIRKHNHILTSEQNTWKVAGSIPDEATGFFNLPNPSSRTMALVRLSL
jgi:hypothetical protein